MVSSCAALKGRNRFGRYRICVENLNATQRDGHWHEVRQMQLVHQIDMLPAREWRRLERHAHLEL